MVKNKTRRILALFILLSLVSRLDFSQKMLLTAPCLVLLLIERGENELILMRGWEN